MSLMSPALNAQHRRLIFIARWQEFHVIVWCVETPALVRRIASGMIVTLKLLNGLLLCRMARRGG